MARKRKFSEEMETVLRTFHIPKHLLQIQELNREIRLKFKKTLVEKETFSDYLRNLIREDWITNKKLLKKYQKAVGGSDSQNITDEDDF